MHVYLCMHRYTLYIHIHACIFMHVCIDIHACIYMMLICFMLGRNTIFKCVIQHRCISGDRYFPPRKFPPRTFPPLGFFTPGSFPPQVRLLQVSLGQVSLGQFRLVQASQKLVQVSQVRFFIRGRIVLSPFIFVPNYSKYMYRK